ncbi:MAG: hypothetical protein L6Q77_07775 [Bacteroidetes bacterium]|nr:hypothetical protein [Bacteroidota bacterium]
MNLNPPFQFKLASDVVPLLNRMEQELDTDSFVIRSVNIWPLIRVQFGYQLHLSFQKDGNGEPGSAPDLTRRFLQKSERLVFAALDKAAKLRDLFPWKPKLTPPLAFALSHARNSAPVSKFKRLNPYLDPFLEAFSRNGWSLFYYEKKSGIPGSRIPYFRASKLPVVQVTPCPVTPDEILKIETINSILTGFLSALDPELSVVFSRIDVRRLTENLFKTEAYFTQILEKIRPELVILYNYYNLDGLGLILASKHLGVPSLELQHSAISDHHFAYGPWTATPTGGYSLLPDWFWVWSQADKKLIETNFRLLEPDNRVFIGGNQWINFWRDQFQRDEARKFRVKIPAEKKTILLCLQGIGIPEFIVQLMKSREFNWLVRFHPRYPGDKQQIFDLKEDNIPLETEVANREDLYTLFSLADYTVTFTSGTALESAAFGTPVIITGENGRRSYRMQIESGQFFFAGSGEDFLEIVNSGRLPARSENLIQLSKADTDRIISQLTGVGEK